MMKSCLIRVLSVFVYYSGLIRILRSLGKKNTKIILYHSVNEKENRFIGGTDMHVDPGLFEKQIEYILKHYKVISMQEYIESLENGSSPENTVLITFDDGFADVYRYAFPLLERFGLPATIFLNTDCMNNRKLLWIQELCYLVNSVGSDRVAERLPSSRDDFDTVSTGSLSNSGDRSHRKVQDYLSYSVSKGEREEILEKLFDDFGMERTHIPGRDEVFLNKQQIDEMADHDIFFGNHGVSHTPFSAMSCKEMELEIRDSRRVMEENLGLDFIPFSYPFGQARDISPEAKDLVIRSGHRCALTAMPTLNHPEVSPFELGRMPVHNVPIYQFAFELEMGVLKKILHWNQPNGQET